MEAFVLHMYIWNVYRIVDDTLYYLGILFWVL